MAVYVYTEQETSPRFFEVIRAIKAETGITDAIIPVGALGTPTSPEVPVVVFGKITDPDYTHTNNVYTYSPAQTLSKANAVTVVGTALKRAAGRLPDVATEPTDWHLVHTDAPDYEIEEELISLMNASELVVDIEVSGNIKTGTLEDDDVKLLTVAFYNPDIDRSVVFQGSWYELADDKLERILAAFLVSYKGEFILHNGKFDVRALNRLLSINVTVGHDTMLMHHVLNQAAGMHGLKELCRLYFNAPDWESEAKKHTVRGGHFENIPLDLLAKYNALDVYWTYQLYKLLKPQIDADEHALTAYELELKAAEFLLRVETRGIPFDEAAANKLQIECESIMEDERAVMRKLACTQTFNPNSPIQVKTALSDWGVKVKGTAVDVLTEAREKMNDDEIPALFIDSLLKYRKAAKISSTYV